MGSARVKWEERAKGREGAGTRKGQGRRGARRKCDALKDRRMEMEGRMLPVAERLSSQLR